MYFLIQQEVVPMQKLSARQTTVILLAGLLALVWTLGTVHARPGKRYDEGSQMCRFIDKGEYDWPSDHWGQGARTFKKVCQGCHFKGNDKGVPFIHPEIMSSEGWNKVFSKKRKACAKDGSWDVLSANELLILNDYLYRNANDTYDPNDADSCG